MQCRKSVSDLTPGEKTAYRQAILDLKTAPSRIPNAQTAVTNGGGTPNRYDDYVWLHSVIGSGGHQGPAFGPWHRELLRQYELDLRQVSGNPDISIPYWDWTTAQASGSAGWPFTDDFLGGFGDATTGQITTSPFSDPTQWRINIRLAGDSSLVLKRGQGGPFTGLSLPDRATTLPAFAIGSYDASPFHSAPTTAQANASFRKYLEFLLHNGVHVWVGGVWNFDSGGVPQDGGHMSFPPVAINDPIFWLLHCSVDRLWTIWQQANPGLTYQPASGANAGHNLNDTMSRFATPAHYNFPLESRPADVLDWHGDDVWYASDLPVITPVSASISFGNVPEGLTMHKPVQFSIRTCQRVRFRITALSGANFADPLAPGGSTTVEPSDVLDPVIGDVYIRFQALGAAGTAQVGSATIEALIDDADGYFAPTVGGEFVVGSWTVTFSATPIARPRTAVALVLDRSGSMDLPAGTLGSRYELLQSSLAVISDIMRPGDAVGLVGYDDLVATIAPVTQMGPLSPPGAGRQAVSNAASGPDLVPRGDTAIGQGMIAGAGVLDAERTLPGTPYEHFAMVVMTDGNENVPPDVGSSAVDAAIAPYSSNVYAIGLGRADGVSAATLSAIANYMLITGDVGSDEQRFRLSKYFVQVLAGVSRTAIIVDPQGELLLGSEHRIPFQVSDSDVSIDVIALCPLALLLEMRLEAPDGTVIDRDTPSPNLVYHVGSEDAFYRIGLPALPDRAAGSHAGEWTAVLSLSERSIRELMRQSDRQSLDLSRLRKSAGLPYSLTVQTYSSLMLDARVNQAGFAPGETLQLFARLTEYQVPVTASARVTVEILDPFGTVSYIPLSEYQPGSFKGSIATTVAGVYHCRFMATGRTRRGQTIQREETRTAAVFRARPADAGPPEASAGDDRRRFCEFLHCLLEEKGAREALARLGLDPASVAKCLARYCRQ